MSRRRSRHRTGPARQPGALALSACAVPGRQRPRRGRVGRRRARQLPDAGWEVRSRNNASPALERNIERFTQYLTLVGLTALLVGGVGVANAVKSHLDRKRDVIATLKSLGASGGRVFSIYLLQVMVLSLIGALIGLALGAALPFIISASFGAMIPLPIAPALHPLELVLALLYGLLTALAFAVWPLGRAQDVPVSALFRDAVSLERRGRAAAMFWAPRRSLHCLPRLRCSTPMTAALPRSSLPRPPPCSSCCNWWACWSWRSHAACRTRASPPSGSRSPTSTGRAR